jgi:hypothetical protein
MHGELSPTLMNCFSLPRTLAAFILIAVITAPASAQEQQLKAAFLYNFAKQTEWPTEAFAAAETPLQICAFSGDAITSAMQTLEGKTVGSRKIAIKALGKPEDAKTCHMVFLGENFSAEFSKLQAALGTAPVLTVGEQAGFTQAGGIMSLTKNSNKMQVKLNVKAAQQARLKLSPQLLKLASGE